jgi:hypothetical protein
MMIERGLSYGVVYKPGLRYRGTRMRGPRIVVYDGRRAIGLRRSEGVRDCEQRTVATLAGPLDM